MTRTVYFVLAGVLAGSASLALRSQIAVERRRRLRDELTGLPNAPWLQAHLDDLVAVSIRDDRRICLAKFEIVNFDDINVILGERASDRLLVQVAGRVRATLPEDAPLVRVGRARFAVVFPHCDRGSDDHAGLVSDALRAPFMVGGVPVVLDHRIGLAMTPPHASDGRQLLGAAAIALKEAKDSDDRVAVYDLARASAAREGFRLLNELPEALNRGDMVLYYQPAIDCRTGRCTGAEALVRWQHPEHGLILPGRFIHAVERTALINSLTEWVLGAALAQLASWRADGHDLGLSVNISARNLDDDSILRLLVELLRHHCVPADRLTLEITEGAVMSHPKAVAERLLQIKHLGICIAIDDFGTGHSSLSYLKDIPTDVVKIDRSFMPDLLQAGSNAKIVGMVIALAHELGLRTVAEGVESAGMLDCLRALDCDMAQGFGIARPMPEPMLRSWLAEARAVS